jgi:hypothetical protein
MPILRQTNIRDIQTRPDRTVLPHQNIGHTCTDTSAGPCTAHRPRFVYLVGTCFDAGPTPFQSRRLVPAWPGRGCTHVISILACTATCGRLPQRQGPIRQVQPLRSQSRPNTSNNHCTSVLQSVQPFRYTVSAWLSLYPHLSFLRNPSSALHRRAPSARPLAPESRPSAARGSSIAHFALSCP